MNHIDGYFKGELSPEEKNLFEARCLSDPAFARMVAFYISLQEHLHQQWVEQKKKEFTQLEAAGFAADAGFPSKSKLETDAPDQQLPKELSLTERVGERKGSESTPLKEKASSIRHVYGKGARAKKPVTNVTAWKTLAVAAAMLGVIALGITMYLQNRNAAPVIAISPQETSNTKSSNVPDTVSAQSDIILDSTATQAGKRNNTPKKRLDRAGQQQLFARHFSPDATPKNEQALLEDAFDNYKKGSYKAASAAYEEALTVVESLETRMPEDEYGDEEKKRLLFYAHYYNALSYLAAGNAVKAIPELNAIKSNPDRYWQSKRQWYLALAYLKTGDVQKATALLKQVAENGQAGTYREKAIRLSNELNGLSAN